MTIAGRKPNEGAPVRHRVPPVHQWTDVEDAPFEGAPPLPPKRGAWSKATRRWWEAVSTMPHCCLWTPTDWQFAFDTALVASRFHGGDVKAAYELRAREKVMGTTLDSRRDLRIRYVAQLKQDVPASVTAIEDYRRAVEE